jgi:hypothetical protein
VNHLAIVRFLVKRKMSKILYITCPETVFEIHVTVDWCNISFRSVSALLGVLKTQCTVGVSCGLMIKTTRVNAGLPRTVLTPAERELTRYSTWLRIIPIETSRSTSYFMTNSCMRISVRGAHLCFQTIVLNMCSFATGCFINTPRLSSLYISFCGQTKHVLRMRVCWRPQQYLSARDNPNVISSVCVRSILVSAFGLKSWTHICYRDSLEAVLPGLLDVISRSSALWGRCPPVFERDISRNVGWNSSVARSASGGSFPVGTLEGALPCSSSWDYSRSGSKTLCSCDSSRCRRVEACSKQCHAALAVKWTEAA